MDTVEHVSRILHAERVVSKPRVQQNLANKIPSPFRIVRQKISNFRTPLYLYQEDDILARITINFVWINVKQIRISDVGIYDTA
jgi:hypothetical protein